MQAEAIPPDVLADIVERVIRERLNLEAYDEVLAAETAAKAELAEVLLGIGR